MKRTITYSCLAAALTVGLSAQAPTASPAAQSGMDSSSKPVTMTGCLRAGDGPGTFVLSNAKAGEKATASASPSAPGTAGTAGSTASAPTTADSSKPAAATVKLTGSPTGVTLSDHVGHTVSVTGTVAPEAGTAPSSAAATTPAEPGAATSAAKAASTLNVSAFSMVSGSCSM